MIGTEKIISTHIIIGTHSMILEKLPPSDSDVIEAGWDNLSYSCHNSSVVVKPKLGTAVMWYNHYIDEEGYLGETDYRTFHGGCDVIKGNKWIANNWIVGSPYTDREKITT
ncbi:L-ascorbic acid binding [Mactra antiquata]